MQIIELVIKIPEEKYLWARSLANSGKETNPVVLAFGNGTPLPKGHGRIGDLDALETEMSNGIKAGLMIEGYESYSNINDMDDCLECVKYADTIIEADREEQG